MCYNCYMEWGGMVEVNERTKKAAELIADLYEQDGCGVGGYAHIVVDDWNLDDSDIDFCIEESLKGNYEDINEDGIASGLNCLTYLKQLTMSERYSAMAIYSDFINV